MIENRHYSLHGHVCPKCNKSDLKILGPGNKGTAVGISLIFGAIGNLAANVRNKNDFSFSPTRYKCNTCGNKFELLPSVASPEEILKTPCSISFRRLSHIVGMAVAQNVWLNGVKVASVGNGETITFKTFVKHNTVFVTDHYGIAFKEAYKFDAESGECVEISFKRGHFRTVK